MRHNKHLFHLLLPLLLCGCFPAAWKTAPAKKEAPVRLSEENTRKVEQLYYKAVGAYTNNELALSLKNLNEISAIHPSYPPALELREKIRRISVTKP
ncbi:MAG: hypothetical protein A2X35_00095 [Elusimicrobia bacterium GWA2_61_42]|nr:MAG: hypothetical protein A2X35_00095 [Elusimicrobia bacterium GWA2_61_42]OGR78094.1 MAG: hypothetical protein A2X38_06800 [Elusimicrobia bacterium GWC2_61_25]